MQSIIKESIYNTEAAISIELNSLRDNSEPRYQGIHDLFLVLLYIRMLLPLIVTKSINSAILSTTKPRDRILKPHSTIDFQHGKNRLYARI